MIEHQGNKWVELIRKRVEARSFSGESARRDVPEAARTVLLGV